MKGNTSVSLGAHFEGFIADKVAEGRYKNASEVIRDALRLLEDEEKEKYSEWARYATAALEEGEASGFDENFDPDKFLEEIHAGWAAKQQAR